jgi:trimeric autotransporter adhesin
MAIIYSYSTISSLDDDDLMVVTDTSMDNLPTRSVKLSTLKGFFSSGSYVLPIASSIVLGGVKIGSGITVGVDGTISTANTTMNTLSGDLTLAQGTGISITNNGVDTITVTNTFTDSPLELINEGNGDGIVLAGRTASNYGNVGDKAVDLSHSNQSSATYGATAVYSFASGYLATASGPYSVSFSGTATGFGSLALGRESQATASNAVALGPLSLATSISALAIGTGATASGSGSIAVGNADSTATYAVAIGFSASASGDFAVAIGHQADSTANYAIGLGYNAKADKVRSAAIGNDSSATHTAAMALGSGAITSADYQIALGSASAFVAVLIASLPNTSSYADDAAAATGGVLVGELYRTDSIVKIRIS